MSNKRFVSQFTVPPHKITTDDTGQAMVLYDPMTMRHIDFGDGCFFIRLHSWDTNKMHPLFRSLLGRTIRVIVETIDENQNQTQTT